MSTPRTNTKTTRRTAADKPAAKTVSKRANGKPAATRKTADKPTAASPVRLSTEQDTIPTDPAALNKLIKITRDRRWRAGRRGEVELAERMNIKLDTLTAARAELTAREADA